MNISIKPGALVTGVQPELILGLMIIQRVFDSYGYETVITEATGGQHMQGSLHYKGLAADLRSKHIVTPAIKSRILLESKLCLGDEFDMILEDPNGPNEHLHLEFQPK